MAENQTSGEKTEQPTPKRRLDARREGTVARSTELAGALGLLSAALVAPNGVTALAEGAFSALTAGYARLPESGDLGDIVRYSAQVGTPLALGVLPVVGTVAAVGIVANLAQVGVMATPKAIAPKADRINPIQGLKRILSRRAVVEGLKATFKLALFGGIAFAAVRERWETLVNLSALEAAPAARELGTLAHTVLVRIGVVWTVLAILDYAYQRYEVEKQLRMTRDELRREMKEQEGSPEVKAAQRQRRRRLAKGGLGARVREADVVVTNPTHLAVALKYDRSRMHSPMVVAKGRDSLALRIRELAREVRVPVVENRELARALYRKCEVGDFVPRELFAPVAEVLAYVYETVKRVKR